MFRKCFFRLFTARITGTCCPIFTFIPIQTKLGSSPSRRGAGASRRCGRARKAANGEDRTRRVCARLLAFFLSRASGSENRQRAKRKKRRRRRTRRTLSSSLSPPFPTTAHYDFPTCCAVVARRGIPERNTIHGEVPRAPSTRLLLRP